MSMCVHAMHCSVWDPACMHTCIHGTNAHVYMTTYIHVVNGMAGNFRVLGCKVCWLPHAVKCSNCKWAVCHNTLPLQLVVGSRGCWQCTHTLRLSTAASFPRRATKVQGGEMLYEFTSPATIWKWKQVVTQARASGLVMFNRIIHLTCVWSILYPIESQRNWTTTHNLHQTCILCDTYYKQVHFVQFQPALMEVNMEVIYTFACCIILGTQNTLYIYMWHLVGWMNRISIHHFCASWIHWLYEHLIKQSHTCTLHHDSTIDRAGRSQHSVYSLD